MHCVGWVPLRVLTTASKSIMVLKWKYDVKQVMPRFKHFTTYLGARMYLTEIIVYPLAAVKRSSSPTSPLHHCLTGHPFSKTSLLLLFNQLIAHSVTPLA
jgi:hypothetical protein